MLGPGVAEAQAQEIRIAAAGREDTAWCDADAGLDGLVEEIFGIDPTGQFEPQDGATDRFRGARLWRKVLGHEGGQAIRIALQDGA